MHRLKMPKRLIGNSMIAELETLSSRPVGRRGGWLLLLERCLVFL